MIKKLSITLPLASIIALSLPIQGNSTSPNPQDKLLTLEMPFIPNDQIALMYLTSGNGNLISFRYEMALEDLEKSLNLLNDSSSFSEDFDAMKFLIYFSSIIACDNLKLTEQCMENIALMRELIENFYTEQTTLSQSEDSFLNQRIVTKDLKELISMATSQEIRQILCHSVAEIFPFLNEEVDFHIIPAKSIGKRIEKFAHNVERTWNKLLDLLNRTFDTLDRARKYLPDEGESI